MIAAGAFSFGALCNAWAAVNSELPFADLERTWADNVPVPATSDSMRAGAIGTVVMFGNLGGLVATWTVRRTRLACLRAPLLTRLQRFAVPPPRRTALPPRKQHKPGHIVGYPLPHRPPVVLAGVPEPQEGTGIPRSRTRGEDDGADRAPWDKAPGFPVCTLYTLQTLMYTLTVFPVVGTCTERFVQR